MGSHPPGPAEPSGTASTAYMDMPVGEFLRALSAATPEPGGGSAAALTVALAASLCAMTAELSARQLPAADARHVVAEAQRLRDRAAPLAQADAKSYRAVIAALRDSTQSVDAALSAASTVPLAVAEIGAQVAALAATIAERGNPNVRGDAITAAQLASAAAQAAAELVRINLARALSDNRPAQARELASKASLLAATTARPR